MDSVVTSETEKADVINDKNKKLKIELKVKNNINWYLSVSWIRTTRTQPQIQEHKPINLNKKKKTMIKLKYPQQKFKTKPKLKPNLKEKIGTPTDPLPPNRHPHLYQPV